MPTGLLYRQHHTLEEIGIGAAGILAPHRNAQALVAGIGQHIGDAGQHVLPSPPTMGTEFRVDLPVGDGHREMHPARTRFGGEIDIGAGHAAPRDDLGAATPCCHHHRRDCRDVLASHGGGSSLDLVHSGGRQRGGDVQLLRQSEGDARCLLAIAQGAVVDDYEGKGCGHGAILPRRRWA